MNINNLKIDFVLMSEILTIIVPTYNMEAYLDRCLTSLIVGEPYSEPMQSIEVLVVNDGSTDRSSEIAHDYESHYPNTFKVIDKENGNYGSCINVALPLATGKYIKILDADDYMDTDSLCQYLNILNELDVDMVFNNMDIVNRNHEKTGERKIQLPERQILTFKEICEHTQEFFVHKIAYRTSLLRDIGYHQTEGISYSDNEWVAKPMIAVSSAYHIPLSIYNYNRDREGQTISKESKSKSLGSLKTMILSLGELWNSYNGETLRKQCLYKLFFKQIQFVYNEFFNHQYYSDIEFRDFDKELLQRFPVTKSQIEELRQINCLLFYLHPISYWRSRNTPMLWIVKLRIKAGSVWKRVRGRAANKIT